MSNSCAAPTLRASSGIKARKAQRTLGLAVSAQGIGLFTGERVNLRITPAGADTGIVFQRVDLPNKPFLPARLEFVQGTPRCTILGSQGATIQTVEHILAALRGYQIDNALIELSGPEVPIFDGSASVFSALIEQAGVVDQDADRPIHRLGTPIYWSQGDVHLIALPSDEYRISYTLHYPHSRVIGTQFFSLPVEKELFKSEIAPCRTFSLYEEIAPIIDKGLMKGGSLENAVVVKEGKIVNPEGVRFADEMVRHKILDVIGDLSLVPYLFSAHIIAIRAGHASNTAFARELLNQIKMENV